MKKGQSILKEYCNQLIAKGLAKKTRDLYMLTAKQLIEHTADPGQPTEQEVNEYIIHLHQSTKRNSARTMITTMKNYLKYVGWTEQQIKTIKLPKQEKGNPEFLTESEFQKFIEKMENDSDLLYKGIISVLLYAGLRIGECIGLKERDIDFFNHTITVHATKTMSDRTLPLHPKTEQHIKQYIKHKRETGIKNVDFLFVGKRGKLVSTFPIRTRIIDYCIESGINKKIHPHSLRHTALTHLYKRTGDLLATKEMAGHSNTKTTEIYVHLAGTDHLKKVYNDAYNIQQDYQHRENKYGGEMDYIY